MTLIPRPTRNVLLSPLDSPLVLEQFLNMIWDPSYELWLRSNYKIQFWLYSLTPEPFKFWLQLHFDFGVTLNLNLTPQLIPRKILLLRLASPLALAQFWNMISTPSFDSRAILKFNSESNRWHQLFFNHRVTVKLDSDSTLDWRNHGFPIVPEKVLKHDSGCLLWL